MNKWLALVILLGLADAPARRPTREIGLTPYSPVNSVLHGGG